MATAEELLRNAIAEDELEGHIIVGSDRFITVPDELKRLGVQHDHNIETVTFDCPRYWDNHDMSTMKVYINYMLSNGYKDRYLADNVTVDEDIIHFDWTISHNVTQVPGKVSFLICVMSADADGNEERHWNSELCQDCSISAGMECTEVPINIEPDIITQILLRIDSLDEAIKNIPSGGGSAEDAVLYTEQTLTEEQQAQARANIGAADGKFFKKEASANLFNVNDSDAFYGRIGGSGAEITDESLFTTGYIEAVTGETIYATRENETSGLRVDLPLTYAYVYDSNKNRLALHQVGSDNSAVFEITDANVAFVRVTFGAEWFESPNLMIAKSADIEYAEYCEVFAIKKEAIQKPVEEIFDEKMGGLRISKDQTDFIVPSVNLFDKTSELNQNNYTLNSAEPVDGQTTRDDSQFISHPIAVKYGDIVRLNTDFNYIYGFAEDGSYKRAYTLSPYPDRAVTIDRDTVTQIRVSFRKDNISENWIQSCMITVNNEMPEEYQPFGNIALSNDVGLNAKQESRVAEIIRNTVGDGGDYLSGKILAAAGDSITYGLRADVDAETGWYKNYAALVALRHGMTYYNYGVSGSTLSNYNDKSFCVTRYQEMADNIDYLTIWFGWNDFAYSTLGSIDDTEDTTFYGAWNKVLPYLINKYSTAKIGLVVPYGTNADWREAVRLVAKKFGLPYLDLMSENTPLFFEKEYVVDADVVALRKSTFLADGTHPNQVGYNYLSTIYENWLKSL